MITDRRNKKAHEIVQPLEMGVTFLCKYTDEPDILKYENRWCHYELGYVYFKKSAKIDFDEAKCAMKST